MRDTSRPAPARRTTGPRRPVGMSAVLLPLDGTGEVDWAAFEGLRRRTLDAGLVPAVNMDTGYVQLIGPATRDRVLDVAASVCGPGNFVAGAYVEDGPGAALDLDGHVRALDAVARKGGTPVVFPSHGLNAGSEAAWVAAHEAMGRRCDRYIAFELGPMFVRYGRIYSLDAYEALLGVDACVGAKHSSLSRQAEWDRLAVRDRVRPGFQVLTGNDLAIDMICDGSDYLLGLSAFAPDAFAERDRRWAEGDPSFWELNDLLQYLGFYAFRAPVPAYRHDAAILLQARGWIASDRTPPGAPRRGDPAAERAVLVDILERLGEAVTRAGAPTATR
jgi:dihydrodipicolinate synthase/N-acetylneuraminate lyase